MACYGEFKLWIVLVENLLASMIFDIESTNKSIEASSDKSIAGGWSVLRRSFPDVISCYNFMCDAQPSDIAPLLCWMLEYPEKRHCCSYMLYIMCGPRRSAVCALGVRIVDRWMFGLIEPSIHLSSTWIEPCAIALICKASLPS